MLDPGLKVLDSLLLKFTCNNGNCVSSSYKCDSYDDCRDNSDEFGCDTCVTGSVRLVGTSSSRAGGYGRVEVCYNNTWGTICGDAGWDYDAAKVVCSQLGFYGSPSSYYGYASYGQGSGKILLSGLYCYGYESTLFSCSRGNSVVGVTSCSHSQDASVSCSSSQPTSTTTSYYYYSGPSYSSSSVGIGVGVTVFVVVFIFVAVCRAYARQATLRRVTARVVASAPTTVFTTTTQNMAAPTPGYPSGYSAPPPTYSAPPPAYSAPATGYPATGYPATGYPATGYPATGYPATGYPATGYSSAPAPTLCLLTIAGHKSLFRYIDIGVYFSFVLNVLIAQFISVLFKPNVTGYGKALDKTKDTERDISMEAHERKKQRDKKRYANDPESKKSYEKARPLENRIIREEDERKKQSDKKGYVNDNKKINPWRHSLFEPSASVQAPDGFDAVSVQNVGSTYIIVSWDLPTDSPPVMPAGTALQLEWASSVLQPACPVHCDSNLLSIRRTALLGDTPDPESDTNDIVISSSAYLL
eukprot:Em0005g99a